MSKIEDGGPAFPHMMAEGHPDYARGLSLRDWFAGQALPAVIAATSAGQLRPTTRDTDTHIAFAIAREAYFMADAMLLSAREPKP